MKAWLLKTIHFKQWVLVLLLVWTLLLGAINVAIVHGVTDAQGSVPTILFTRTMQMSCVPPSTGQINPGVDVCDIENFQIGDDKQTVWYRSPDPLSATISGDWTQHCPTFPNLPNNVKASIIDPSTGDSVEVGQPGTTPVCEAYFTLQIPV